MKNLPKFVYFKNYSFIDYPTGKMFSYPHTITYHVKSIANYVNKLLPTGKLILVARGHSGSILAGAVGYLLCRKKREVIISISRKKEHTHGQNLEGIPNFESTNAHIIVIDDFVCSGNTIKCILKDLDKKILLTKKFDILCVCNEWNEATLKQSHPVIRKIVSRFNYIICNDPKYLE